MLATNTHILFTEFEYHAPETIQEVTALLALYGADARVMAGGTDLLVQMKMERRQPTHVISLARVRELSGITQEPDGSIRIGATTRVHDLYRSPLLQRYSALHEAANLFSTVQIMYMATLGGNLCNASPASDSAPCLLVYDASVSLKSRAGERAVPLQDFFVAPGKTVLQPDEILTSVLLPPHAGASDSAFIKMSRVAADISQVCAAVRINRTRDTIGEVRIALGSVAPTPVRAREAERAAQGNPYFEDLAAEIGKLAADEIQPIDDVRATRAYRKQVASVIVRDALIRAWERTLV